jgi:hypothetical protein
LYWTITDAKYNPDIIADGNAYSDSDSDCYGNGDDWAFDNAGSNSAPS